MKYENSRITDLFTEGLSPLDQRLFGDKTEDFTGRFHAFLQTTGRSVDMLDHQELAHLMAGFLLDELGLLLHKMEELNSFQVDFGSRYLHAQSEAEQEAMVLEFSRNLGASERQLRGDRRALKRWFGFDAVLERCNRRKSESEYAITFILSRLGYVSAAALGDDSDHEIQRSVWQSLNLGESLQPALDSQGDSRVHVEALRSLARAIDCLGPVAKLAALNTATIERVTLALEKEHDVWVQCEALNLLRAIDTNEFVHAVRLRLRSPGEGDDIFFRRRAILLVAGDPTAFERLSEVLPDILEDPSPYVRQALAIAIGRALIKEPGPIPPEKALGLMRSLLFDDSVPQVRAAVLLELPQLLTKPHLFEPIQALFTELFCQENDSFVLRTALKAVTDSLTSLLNNASSERSIRFHAAILQCMEDLHKNARDLSVRRWAAMTMEGLFVLMDTAARTLRRRLEAELSNLRPGQSKSVSKSVLGDVGEETLGRVLSVLSQDDFGYSIQHGRQMLRVTKGDIFGLRLWRFLHEYRSPCPDKRQGYSHLLGRTTRGSVRAPSAIVSEYSQTEVPGEPLRMASESGWRPYLPLVDDMLSSLGGWFAGRPLRIYSAEGVTKVVPPRFLGRRLLAFLELTLRFNRYAALRNWSEDGLTSPRAYVTALDSLGFRVSHEGYGQDDSEMSQDPAVARFFGLSLPIVGADFFLSFKDYLLTPHPNTIFQLAVFSGALLAVFVGRRVHRRWAVLKARNSFKLVIGGWGTSGKSAVERLKAALFEGLGHGLVDKTTGCAAMFLHAYPFGKTSEMLLYRSYDKATIWEHRSLMLLASRLKSKVLLWECMGLKPLFVKILQRQWAMDDYSTITNAYPDHEDVQGPAGINVPLVMTNFIPENGVLVTSEEEMKPILKSAADELNCPVKSVGWLEAGLLTPDVLRRFPYEEHPYNVALVMALAGELGIDPDYAAKEMADRVVPDIGVLKVFPEASVRGRRLQFINGMSANERLSALGNWSRMGFDSVHPDHDADQFICGLINNRADRVSRSRVFASLMVNDLNADLYFLTGSNLSGLQAQIRHYWAEYIDSFRLEPDKTDSRQDALVILTKVARRLRVPTSELQVKKRLRAMLRGLSAECDPNVDIDLGNDSEELERRLQSMGLGEFSGDIVIYIEDQKRKLREFTELRVRLANETPDQLNALNREFKAHARRWFMSKLCVIEDYHASGEQIIARICQDSPPGLHVRIMGMQNIKATGLDLVYRWQAWNTCYESFSALMKEDDPAKFELLLNQLVTFKEYGQLSEDFVLEGLAALRSNPLTQSERAQDRLLAIESNLNREVSNIQSSLGSVRRPGLFPRILDVIEGFLDPAAEVLRRRTADRIYEDLINERISHARAAVELRSLHDRQKGGWMAAKFGL
ncbi:hypothetical protein ACFL2Q_00825 [Thermodesulfobacteriota bacterium]